MRFTKGLYLSLFIFNFLIGQEIPIDNFEYLQYKLSSNYANQYKMVSTFGPLRYQKQSQNNDDSIRYEINTSIQIINTDLNGSGSSISGYGLILHFYGIT